AFYNCEPGQGKCRQQIFRQRNIFSVCEIRQRNIFLFCQIRQYYRFRKDVYENLIEQTKYFCWDKFPEKDSNTGKLTAAGWTIRVHKIMKFFLISSVVLHVIQSGTRLFIFRELMFQVWYPFDKLKSPIFEILYVTQWNNNLCTEDIKCPDNQHETYCDIQKNINGCIRLHQAVIRFLNELENAVSLPLCGIFLLLQVTLCISAFAFIVNWEDPVDLIQAMQGYIMSLFVLAIYCFVGTILTDKFESVRDAAWASDWVGSPIPHQRCLFLIIAQANHKFTLTSGKILPVSNTTMSNVCILQTSSFLAFMLHVSLIHYFNEDLFVCVNCKSHLIPHRI
ncbi:hypothetical protein ANN_17298, partial [Periplaneta americana]